MTSLHQLPVCPIGGKSEDGDGVGANAAPDQSTLTPLALIGAAHFA